MKLVKDKNILRNCKLWQVWLIPSGYGFPMTPDPDYLKRRPLVTLTSLDVSKGNRLYSSLIASLNGASFEPEPRQYKIDTR